MTLTGFAAATRAVSYTHLGDPFQDVPDSAWYAEDVDIAYTEGYISGTSKTTFSPDSSITREEAAIILTRNLMLQDVYKRQVFHHG